MYGSIKVKESYAGCSVWKNFLWSHEVFIPIFVDLFVFMVRGSNWTFQKINLKNLERALVVTFITLCAFLISKSRRPNWSSRKIRPANPFSVHRVNFSWPYSCSRLLKTAIYKISRPETNLQFLEKSIYKGWKLARDTNFSWIQNYHDKISNFPLVFGWDLSKTEAPF